MGFDAFKDKLSAKVNEVIGDEQQTDSALARAQQFVNDKTGDKYADKVEQGRDFIDGKVGDERTGGGNVGDERADGNKADEGKVGDPTVSDGRA